MKHLAQIQSEFVKASKSGWDDMSYDAQKSYLRWHPNSKRRLTAKPVEKSKPSDFMGRSTNQLHFVNDHEARKALELLETKRKGLATRDSERYHSLKFVNDRDRSDAIQLLKEKNLLVNIK